MSVRFICVADFTHKEADSLYTQTEEDQVGAYTGFPRQDGLPEWEEARLGHRIQEVGLLEGHNRLAAADGGVVVVSETDESAALLLIGLSARDRRMQRKEDNVGVEEEEEAIQPASMVRNDRRCQIGEAHLEVMVAAWDRAERRRVEGLVQGTGGNSHAPGPPKHLLSFPHSVTEN